MRCCACRCQVEVDERGALCCDGIVYRRRRGTEQRCCGRLAYDVNTFACCGPRGGRQSVVRRTAVMPPCCDDRSNVECSATGRPSNATHATRRTQRNERNKRNARIDIASILAFWPLRRLRRPRPLRTFVASPASIASRSTQGRCVACVALDGNWALSFMRQLYFFNLLWTCWTMPKLHYFDSLWPSGQVVQRPVCTTWVCFRLSIVGGSVV